MAIAETAKLVSSLELDTRKFDAGIGKASKGLNTLSTRTIAAGTAIGVGLERLAEKGLSALGGAIGEGIQGALTLEKAQAQTTAAIKSTGGAAGVSAQQVRDLANALEDVTTADDKSIQQGENLLLTFTNIGAKAFPQATEAMVNMAIALNKGDAATADFDGTAIQLGKALNDPIKGITALRKVGVSFNDAQIKAIKTAVKAGDTYKAQQIILAELTKEFGNAGKAAGTGFQADINRANDAVEDAKIALAQGLMPALGEVAKVLSSTFRDPQVLSAIRGIGVGIGEAIKNVVAFVRGVDWPKVGAGIKGVFSSLSSIVGSIKSGWDQIPDPLKQLLITGIVADRTMKFLFGFSPASFVISGVEGAVSATLGKAVGSAVIAAGLGKAFVQPVFVTNPGFSGGPGGPGTEVTKSGLRTLVQDVISIASIVAIPAVVGAAIGGLVATGATSVIDPTGLAASQRGESLGNRDPRRFDQYGRIIANYTSELPGIARADDSTAANMEKLRGLIAQPPKTPKQADAILAAGAQRDKETSDAINTIVAQQATSNDIETLRGKIAEGLSSVDTSTMQAGRSTSIAATQAGFHAAQQTAASGWGIEGAIARNRPIINVDVQISATDITQVNVVEDRGGSRSGSRDGDGGGGPGQ